MKTVIYYKPEVSEKTSLFKEGCAVAIDLEEWYVEAQIHEPHFDISINTYSAMYGYGVFDIWNELILDYCVYRPFDQYEETTILKKSLPEASVLLRKYIRELNVEKLETDLYLGGNDEVEYRIVVDIKAFIKDLISLANFIDETATYPKKSIEFWL
ncbi:hypothetical protein [Colwellia sp. MB3u-55]|jgi:hypothetical protein|uniref:hypothetical protein n=1 Tax=Colwellia sp. MB3u-55 TaxID=2759810 RepID=UPI0015F65A1F|nr:hypothetical protein [Colwellia sp. MB3u-55]MBA6250814.1 hypothetical protein [Colwellia sp. MB3u-55]